MLVGYSSIVYAHGTMRLTQVNIIHIQSEVIHPVIQSSLPCNTLSSLRDLHDLGSLRHLIRSELSFHIPNDD